LFKRNTDILQRFARRRMPNDIAEVEGQEELLQLRQIDIYQGPSDVYEVAFAAGAGYGDPLKRDPEAVRRDVYLEDISARGARELFGVVLIGQEEDLRVDVPATAKERRLALTERLGRQPQPYAGPRFPTIRQITENLDLIARGAEQWLACSQCGYPLGIATGNYKLYCHRVTRPIQAANTLIGEPERFIDDAVQFRQFCCPACATLIENEICRSHDPVLADIELHLPGRHSDESHGHNRDQ
jgi:N-methylhydantoinase B